MQTSPVDDEMGLKIEIPPSMMGKPRFFFPGPASKISDPMIHIKEVAFGCGLMTKVMILPLKMMILPFESDDSSL